MIGKESSIEKNPTCTIETLHYICKWRKKYFDRVSYFFILFYNIGLKENKTSLILKKIGWLEVGVANFGATNFLMLHS